MRREGSAALRTCAALAALALCCAWGRVASAHGFQPALVEVHAEAGGRVEVAWVTPAEPDAVGPQEELELPSRCEPLRRAGAEIAGESRVRRQVFDCGPRGLAGARVGVSFAGAPGHVVILRYAVPDGAVSTFVLRPTDPVVRLPETASQLGAWAVAWSYLRLGLAHIATGYDHLMFVLGLLLLVRGRRALLGTVTAFTLGHSATLAAAALGLARVPAAPVEALVAASILLLAAQVARPAGSRAPGSARPWRLAAGFGLVHGLGFAGALAEVGLPAGHTALALAAFNAGVELGQLAFVAVASLAALLLRRTPEVARRTGRVAVAYALGVASAYLAFERVAAFWS